MGIHLHCYFILVPIALGIDIKHHLLTSVGNISFIKSYQLQTQLEMGHPTGLYFLFGAAKALRLYHNLATLQSGSNLVALLMSAAIIYTRASMIRLKINETYPTDSGFAGVSRRDTPSSKPLRGLRVGYMCARHIWPELLSCCGRSSNSDERDAGQVAWPAASDTSDMLADAVCAPSTNTAEALA